jgi:hypothetical protein
MELKIPLPVTFNPHKHHLGFLKLQIETWKQQNRESVQTALLCLGENLIDIYFGQLSVEQICNECIAYFRGIHSLEKTAFTDWLGPHEYRKIRLSDSSVWVVKKGVDPERYIHIHPGKHSPFSTRVRATTLKTVIALQVCSVHFQNNRTENLRAVNETRVSFLKLSPVKSIQSGKGIEQLRKRFAAQLTEAAPRT